MWNSAWIKYNKSGYSQKKVTENLKVFNKLQTSTENKDNIIYKEQFTI